MTNRKADSPAGPKRTTAPSDQRRRQLTSYVKRAKELGAHDAKIIGPHEVYCAEWVRLKCQYGCAGYGRTLTCPPHSPTPEQTRRVLDAYSHLLLVHGMRGHRTDRVVLTLEREIFLDGNHMAFAWGAGPCTRCRTCDTTTRCRHPDRARPSMEACGIDVFRTARGAAFPIHVVRTRRDQDNYYGLVAIDGSSSA